MPDKNLTDTEIKKALECCCGGLTSDWCDKCPMNVTKECDKDLLALEKLALDLINRLQAENERLKEEVKKEQLYNLRMTAHSVKAEAYKEFAELVQGEIDDAIHSNYNAKAERMSKPNVDMADEFISYCEGKIHALSGIDSYIDNLLKELVGE